MDDYSNGDIHEAVLGDCCEACKGYSRCQYGDSWTECEGYKDAYKEIKEEWEAEDAK